MDDDEPTIALPLQEFAIGDDAPRPGAIMGLKSGGRTVAATLTPEQLSDIAAQILAWAGTLPPVPQLQTTSPGTLSARPLRVEVIGLAAGPNEESVVLAFPVGHLTLAFEVPIRVLVNVIGKHLAGEIPGTVPPKPN